MRPTNKVQEVEGLIDGQQRGWWRASTVVLPCLFMLVEGYDMQVMNFAAPSIIQAWRIHRSAFAPVFSIGLVGYLIGATLLGSLADRIGRKKILVGGGFVFGVFTLASTFAASLPGLMALRFLAGIGLGSCIPTLIALTVEFTPSPRRARMISVLFASYAIGGAVGGFVAARLIPEFGWHSVFYVGGIVPILLAAILIVALPESVHFLTLTQKQPEELRAPVARLRPGVAIDADTQFSSREQKKSGLPVAQLFTEGRARMTEWLWLAYVMSLLGHYLLTSWLPTVLVGAGVPLTRAVIAGGLLPAGGAVGGFFLCWLLDRRGIGPVSFAFALSAILVCLIAFAASASAPVLLSAVFLTGACLIGGQMALNGAAGTFYPTCIRSTGTGWANGIGRIGSIIGPMLGGLLISFNLPASELFLFVALPALCCAGAVYALGKSGTSLPVTAGGEALATQPTSD